MFNHLIISSLFLSLLFSQYDYFLEDLNETSMDYGQNVGPSAFSNQVTLHYFGHYN